jgi:hypothetical protein
MGIQVHIFGKDELVAKYRRIASNMPTIVNTAMQTQMTQLADYVRSGKLSGQVLNRRSGALSRSIYGTSSNSSGSVVGKVGSRGVPYANIWENTGSAAHTVEAINAKALRFEIGGSVVFAKRVNIPAQNARPFLRPALNERREAILQALRSAVVQVIKAS